MTTLTPYSCNTCDRDIGLLFDVPLQCPFCFSEDVYEAGMEFGDSASTEVEKPVRSQVAAPEGQCIVYTDGSCLDASVGDGGWAFAYKDDSGSICSDAGFMDRSTNNQAELEATIKALEHFREPAEILVISDSKYVVNGANSWIHSWKERGWIRGSGRDRSPVKNKEFWLRLDSEMSRHKSVSFQWVKGHDGDEMNELCDKLASEAASRSNK